MKRIRTFIVLVIFQTASISSYCQSTPQPVNLDAFPPTPNAAALMKFTDVPVNGSTGIPGISVPIYSYKGNNGLGFNISLDYHAGGTRVEEVASDVGIGWALNAGGQVARVMRGMPDDFYPYGYFNLGSLQPASQILDDYQHLRTAVAENIYKNLLDGQSDIYSYSINNKSGKFIFGLDGTVALIPQSKIQVQRIINTGHRLTGFVITDVDGTQYRFEQYDNVTNSFTLTEAGVPAYGTTWNLTKIIAPYGTDTIALTYESYGLTYDMGRVQTQYADGVTYAPVPSRNVDIINQYAGTANRLKTIQFPDNTLITCSYETKDRMDISTSGALQQILISNGANSYGYKLGHSYGANGTYAAPTAVSSTLRMQLDDVTQFSGTTSLPPYKFTYNGTLPDRMSLAQDFWGYYYGNVRQNPNTLIPSYPISAQTTLAGADRTPDADGVKIGSLTTVTWPTGGTTTYEYEANSGSGTNLLAPTVQTIYAATGTNLVPNGYQNFTVSRPLENMQPITFNFNLGSWCPGVETTCIVELKVTSLDNSIVYATQDLAFGDLGTTKTVNVDGFADGNYKVTYTTFGATNCTCTEAFNISVSYNQFVQNSVTTPQLAGGLRIKSITQYDGLDHAHDMIKEFSYLNADGSSSGSIWLKPSFTYSYIELGGWDPNYCGYNQVNTYFIRSSAVNYPLTYTNGAPILYSRVTEKDKIGAAYNGQTISYYRDYLTIGAPCTEGSGGNCFPYATMIPLDFGLGYLTEQDIYDNINTLVKKTVNQYNYVVTDVATPTNFRSIKFGAVGENIQAQLCRPLYELNYREYFPLTGRIEKTSETTTDYTSTGSSMTKETDYTYDPNYYNLKAMSSLNSKNQRIETRYYYPYDYTAGSAITNMRDNGIIAPVISAEQWLLDPGGNSLIGGSVTDFGFYSGTIIRPSKLYLMKSSSPVPQSVIGSFNPAVLNRNSQYFIQENSYDQYDAKGNINQYTGKSGPGSIIWNINKQYPVAKLINAGVSSAAYTGFESDGTGNWTLNSAVRVPGGITGSQSYSLNNGTITYSGGLLASAAYIISYWSNTGGQRVNSSPPDLTGMTVNGWTYYEHKIQGATSITLSTGSGTGTIDELRLYPAGALMTTYTYTPMIGVTAVCDPANKLNYYEYDVFGRLKLIRDQERNILKTFKYQYQEQQ
jgi:hypothetical protein